MPPLLVQASLSLAAAIIAEASLSFLGFGQQPPSPSWGSMLNTAQRFLTQAPWLAVFPGVAIFLCVLSFNLVGDGLRDALDPRGPELITTATAPAPAAVPGNTPTSPDAAPAIIAAPRAGLKTHRTPPALSHCRPKAPPRRAGAPVATPPPVETAPNPAERPPG